MRSPRTSLIPFKVFFCPLTLMKLSSLSSDNPYKMFIMYAKCFKVILTFPPKRFTRKASVIFFTLTLAEET